MKRQSILVWAIVVLFVVTSHALAEPTTGYIVEGDIDHWGRARWLSGSAGKRYALQKLLLPANQKIMSISSVSVGKAPEEQTPGAYHLATSWRVGSTSNVAFSRDLRYVAYINMYGMLSVADIKEKSPPKSIMQRESFSITMFTFSPDGRYILTADKGSQIKLWEAGTGQELRNYKRRKKTLKYGVPIPILCLDFSRNGKLIAAGLHDSEVTLWDSESARELLSFSILRKEKPRGRAVKLLFNTESTRLFVCAQQVISSLDLESPSAQLQDLIQIEPSWHDVALSPDGNRLAFLSGRHNVQVFDASNGAELWNLSSGNAGAPITFSPDSRFVISHSAFGGKPIVFWDIEKGKRHGDLRLENSKGPIHTLAFSPNGERLGVFWRNGLINIWSAEPSIVYPPLFAPSKVLKLKGRVNNITFSPDGRYLALSDEKINTTVLEVDSGAVSMSMEGGLAAFSPTENLLAVSDRVAKVTLWDIRAKRIRKTIIVNEPRLAEGGITCLAFGPDGKYLAAGCRVLKLFDVTTGDQKLTLGEHGYPISVAFSNSGDRIVTTGKGNNSLKIWNAATGTEIPIPKAHKGRSGIVRSAFFDPTDHFLVSAGRDYRRDSAVRVWDSQFNLLNILPIAGDYAIFSPDGTLIASGHNDRGEVRIFNAQKLTELTKFNHQAVHCLAFSPNGRYLATGGWDRKLRVWDLAPLNSTGGFGQDLIRPKNLPE